MRKIKKEKKKVEVEKEVIVEDITYCDVCGKEIKKEHWRLHCVMNNAITDGKDACSKKCIEKELGDYITESSKHNEGGALFEVFYVPSREVESTNE